MDFEFNLKLDGDDEEAEEKFAFFERDATVFLVDACGKMFNKVTNEDGCQSHFSKSLKCIHSTITRNIISNDQDMYSVIVFNSKQKKNGLDFNSIFILQDMERPDAERVLELEHYFEEDCDSSANEKFGTSSNADIHEVLWICRKSFIDSKKKFNSKNVLLFTCEDAPHEVSALASGSASGTAEHKRRQALKGAKDLRESGIDIEILPLKKPFNANKLYKDLILEGIDEASAADSLSVLEMPSDRFEELLLRTRRLQHKQRSTTSVTMRLAPGTAMGLKVFTAVGKVVKSKTKLYRVTNEEVVAQRKEFLENGELLMPSDFVKYQEFGGRKIKFSLDEIKAMGRMYVPGLELLGFKPMSALKPHLYIRPAHFVYPNETAVKGSRELFACLLERCLARQVCIVVRVCAREGSAMAWGLLWPQKERCHEDGSQEAPPGFYLCYLPFADDFRSVSLENRPRASSVQVDVAKSVLKKLHFKFDPECFENPDLQTHWRNIEALALNKISLEPVVDYTVPDYGRMEKKAGDLLSRLQSLVLPPDYDPEAKLKYRQPQIRPATTGGGEGPAKRQRTEAPRSVEEMAQQRKVDKLTMDALKQWLQLRGVRVSGKKKAQLVDDVYEELQIDA